MQTRAVKRGKCRQLRSRPAAQRTGAEPGCPGQQESASAPPHRPHARLQHAIRTGTPLATCASTRDRAITAASASISSPRLIGPGCITIAPAFIRSSRSRMAHSRRDTRGPTRWPRTSTAPRRPRAPEPRRTSRTGSAASSPRPPKECTTSGNRSPHGIPRKPATPAPAPRAPPPRPKLPAPSSPRSPTAPPRAGDITHDRERRPKDRTTPCGRALGERQDVEQALRRVLVASVAGVDDRALHRPRDVARDARLAGPHDHAGPRPSPRR